MSAVEQTLVAGQLGSTDDDESRIIDAFDTGTHVAQGDVEDVVEAIEEWRANPELVAQQGRNAREAFEHQFTRDHAIDEYYRLLVDEETPLAASPATPKPIRS
jgi:glycosyltransferase involved in cell wall biosynthesis